MGNHRGRCLGSRPDQSPPDQSRRQARPEPGASGKSPKATPNANPKRPASLHLFPRNTRLRKHRWADARGRCGLGRGWGCGAWGSARAAAHVGRPYLRLSKCSQSPRKGMVCKACPWWAQRRRILIHRMTVRHAQIHRALTHGETRAVRGAPGSKRACKSVSWACALGVVPPIERTGARWPSSGAKSLAAEGAGERRLQPQPNQLGQQCIHANPIKAPHPMRAKAWIKQTAASIASTMLPGAPEYPANTALEHNVHVLYFLP